MSKASRKNFRTPGVYINELPSLPPPVAQAATAIPAFIGYTQKAVDESGKPLHLVPTKIFSLIDYEGYFGLAENETGISVQVNILTNPVTSSILSLDGEARITDPSVHNLHHSVRLYFANGGGPCYIVSIGGMSGLLDPDDFVAGIDSLEVVDDPTIILFPEGQGLSEHTYYGTVINHAIDQCARLKNRFTLVDVHHSLYLPADSPQAEPSVPDTTATITNFRTAFGRTGDLKYAAAYYPNLKTTIGFSYNAADVMVVVTTNGISAAGVALETLVAQPAIYNLSRDRIRNQLNPILPPSPAIAGIYVKVDETRGVWKAPANMSINSVYEVTDIITSVEQENMNVDPVSGKSVNAIRSFPGKGVLVWGARTLDGNSFEWKYISNRRFFMMVEASVKKATYPFVFEPNDRTTWIKIKTMVDNYLVLLWRQGALAGMKPEQAFFVNCGHGQTMTSQDILDGKLIVEIGLAVVRPAEFIILRFEHKLPA